MKNVVSQKGHPQFELEKSRELTKYSKSKMVAHVKDGIKGIVYSFENPYKRKNQFMAVGFIGNSKRHNFYYQFESVEQRDRYIENFFLHIQRVEEDKQQRKQTKIDMRNKMAETFVVGSLLTGSWGYEQTNWEFYQIVERPSRFTAVVQRIGESLVKGSEGFDSCKVKPLKDVFIGEPILKKIMYYGIGFEHFTLSLCDDRDGYYKSWGY